MSGKGGESRYWLTEIYEESAPLAVVIEKLTVMGAMALISPEHKDDVNQKQAEDGTVSYEKKKPHRHVILCWEGSTTRRNAEALVAAIGGVGCLKAITFRGSARYHCHLDNPEKAQYNPLEEIVIGPFDYFEIINSSSDDLLTLQEIYDFVREKRIIYYDQFIIFCQKYRKDWFRVVSTKQRENVFRFLRSQEHHLLHQGRILPELDADGNGDTGAAGLIARYEIENGCKPK